MSPIAERRIFVVEQKAERLPSEGEADEQAYCYKYGQSQVVIDTDDIDAAAVAKRILQRIRKVVCYSD